VAVEGGDAASGEAKTGSSAVGGDVESGGGGGEATAGCGHVYCFVHSDAHPGQTCRQYERAHRAEEKATAAAIGAFARPCPGCKQPIEKSGGCNHMTCPNPGCGVSFCWLCGRKIGGGAYPNHYAPWNLAGCPAMQMGDDARAATTSNRGQEARMCCYRLCYPPLALGAASLVLALVLAYLAVTIGWALGFGAVCLCLCFPVVKLLELCGDRCGHRCGSVEDLGRVRGCLFGCTLLPLLPFAACADSD
jgi:hypothetical protein